MMAKARAAGAVMASERADFINRCVAKFVDIIIAGAMSQIVRLWGPLAGLTYLLIADGILEGRSPGKRLIGLRVVDKYTDKACDLKKSIIRNVPLGLVFLFAMIPFVGWILFFTVGLIIVAFECWLMYSDDGGSRIGDILADTQVLSDKIEDA